MLAYVTVGTNDLARGAAFYDALLAELGARRAMEMERLIIWAAKPGEPMFALAKPYDGKPATVGNGSMVALQAGSKEAVDRVHAKALALGGKDEGAPGPRGDGFYGAYFRDLDGNKFVACVFG
jgi:catechol 2,3-dioxygenase-like lactoylglutathione lyase family enzyme